MLLEQKDKKTKGGYMLTADTLIYCVATIASIFISNSMTKYRIEQLEKKVEKHNSVVERMALAEKDIKVLYHDLNKTMGEVQEMREERE